MIRKITTAIEADVGLGQLAGVIHPYPTQAEAIRHTADAYNRSKLTPGIKKSSINSWHGAGEDFSLLNTQTLNILCNTMAKS